MSHVSPPTTTAMEQLVSRLSAGSGLNRVLYGDRLLKDSPQAVCDPANQGVGIGNLNEASQ